MTGLVKNDPALQVSWSAGSRTMPRARRWASTASRASAKRHPVAERNPKCRSDIRVADRRRPVPERQLEGHVEHDVPVVGLEQRAAVGEAALPHREGADPLLAPVPGAHRADRLGHLLAVGTDVLHRRGPGRAGDAGQRLDADPALGDGPARRRRPRARPRRPAATSRCRCPRRPPRRRGSATWTTVPSKPSSLTSRLDPPATTSSGSSASSTSCTASTRSSVVVTVTSRADRARRPAAWSGRRGQSSARGARSMAR